MGIELIVAGVIVGILVGATGMGAGSLMLAFAAVYLAGYFDLRDRDAFEFWVKGIVTWAVHFAFLICACAHVVRRGRDLFIRCVWAFVAGMVVNCIYGAVQLALQVGVGVNLDTLVVGPLTAGQGKQGGLGVFGQVAGEKTVYRINALTGDPNHLGVMPVRHFPTDRVPIPAKSSPNHASWPAASFPAADSSIASISGR